MDKDKLQKANAAVGKAVEPAGSFFNSFLRVIGTLILIGAVTILLFMVIFAYYVKTCITPSIDIDLDDFTLNQSSLIYYQDSNGDWQELEMLSGSENRIWVDYENIPKYMEQALVSIEDKRFYRHKGVDWFRTCGAFVNMFIGMRNTFGGSTITQQLIKNITQQDDITVQRKLLEIFQALEFEKDYSKQEIIEYYLNTVYFGEGCYGVQTAAQTYFGKDVSELSLAEAAAIVGITNLPSYYDPFMSVQNNKDRQETVLYEMYDQGYITKQEYDGAVAEELEFIRGENTAYEPNIYSWYVETVIDDVSKDLAEAKNISEETARSLIYNAGYKIYSCIDLDIQQKIEAIYKDVENLPKTTGSTQKQLQSAIVVMDQYTGNIVGICGGTGEKSGNRLLNRATDSTLPPGSSIKPIAVYGPAVEYGLISPSTLVLDADGETIKLQHSSNGWFPRNSPDTYDGIITIFTALQKSKNTVSAQILDKLTPSASFDFITEKLGVTSLLPEDANFSALALGQPSYGLTVREMAQAYCALANEGVYTEARTYYKVTDSEGNIVLEKKQDTWQAFSSSTAETMTYMLNNAATYGTGYESRLSNMPVAGKTGTTSSNKDRWFVGYTPYYTAAVWTGYDEPEYMSFRGNPATQIWQRVMTDIHADLEYKDFVMSYGRGATGIFGSQEELQALLDKANGVEEEEEVDPEASPSPSTVPANTN